MGIQKNNLLTASEIMHILIGSIIGIGILSLPNSLVENAYQDAWISVAIGSIYPIYIILLIIFIVSRYPKDNILVLSKKYCGTFIGTILNFVFLTFFFVYTSLSLAGFSNLIRTYSTPYISSFSIVFTSTLIIAYTAYKGVKVLGKINQLSAYLLMILILASIPALAKGRIENLFPMFQSNFKGILKGAKESTFSYAGLEFIAIIYPFVNDAKKVKSSLLKGILIPAIIYIYVVFITIYYLGVDIIPKDFWSFVVVIESVTITVINNFRFIFVVLWIGIEIPLCSNYFYALTFILKDIFKKTSRMLSFILSCILIVALTMMFVNEPTRKKFLEFFVPKYTIFNIFYISLISLLIFFKKGEKSEKY